MPVDTLWRRSLSVAGALAFAVALALAVVVIPRVRTDPTPQATPERALPVFMGVAVVQVLIGLLALFVARRRTTAHTAGRIPVLVVVGLACLLQAIAFLDAASAYRGHGAHMVVATVTLFACVAAETAIGLVSLSAGLRRWPAQEAGPGPPATDR
jgi:hypothetical protein